jgi:hypothetical protein
VFMAGYWISIHRPVVAAAEKKREKKGVGSLN